MDSFKHIGYVVALTMIFVVSCYLVVFT